MGKTHVTNNPTKESSIHSVLLFSNSYQRDNQISRGTTSQFKNIQNLSGWYEDKSYLLESFFISLNICFYKGDLKITL